MNLEECQAQLKKVAAELKKLQDESRVQLQRKNAELQKLKEGSQTFSGGGMIALAALFLIAAGLIVPCIGWYTQNQQLRSEVEQLKASQPPAEYVAVVKELERWSKEWDASDEKKNKNYTLLHYVCGKGAPSAVISELCSRGESIEARCTDAVPGSDRPNSWTPLHVASYTGNVEAVNALLHHKADIEARDNANGTPLHLASYMGFVDAVSALIDRKADIEAKDISNGTPLHVASYMGKVEVVKTLLEHKADIEAKAKSNWTPLHLASLMGFTNVVNELLDHKADIEAKDSDISTPLHLASRNGQVDVVLLLMRRGADINAKDKDGHIPASVTSNKDILAFLTQGVFPNVV